MSLFGNLFATKGGGSSSLFAETSKFKASDASKVPPLKKSSSSKSPRTSDDLPAAAGSKRKRDTAAPATLSFGGEKTKSEGAKQKKTIAAVKTQRPKAVEAKQQAEKVADKARQLAADDVEDDGSPIGAKPEKKSKKKKKQDGEKKEAALGGEGSVAVVVEKKEKKTKKMKVVESEEKAEEKEEEAEAEEETTTATESAAVEASKLYRTIFVGNLPFTVKKKSIGALFTQYGAVESVRLRSVPLKTGTTLPRHVAVAAGAADTSRGSSHAYVVFKEETHAHAALSHNMQEWKGQHLRVDMAGAKTAVALKSGAPKKKKSADTGGGGEEEEDGPDVKYDPARSVFIGNLHIQTVDEELIRFFINGVGAGSDAELEAVRIVRDPKTSLGKGIAFALFKSKSGRRAALGLDGRTLRERPLRISVIKSGMGSTYGGTGASNFKKKSDSIAPWQGVTATQSGRSRGPTGKPETEGKRMSFSGKSGGGGGMKKKKSGKRPAVEARKQKQVGQVASVKKKKMKK